jgi:transposase-like protein
MFERKRMVKDTKKKLYQLLLSLSEDEKSEIITLLTGKKMRKKENLSDTVADIRARRFANGYFCPYCGSSKIVRFGTYRDSQRYQCKACRKTFTDLTSTALNYIHDKEKFFASAYLMLSGATLEETAKELGISIPTAFSWRHKVLDMVKNTEDENLFGIIEADDTFFLASRKGERNIDRKPRKRGGSSKKRGISDDQVCVLVARDRTDNTVTDVVTVGRPSADEIDRILGDRISKKSMLLTDMHPSFSSFAKHKNLNYMALDLGKGRRSIKGIYHIQNVNSYHSRLKNWIARFKGVATKYLSNYLHWFEFIDTVAKGKTRQAARRALLLGACSVKVV